MARLTGLFQRGTSYYIQVVLPHGHPLKSKYKNGKFVTSLGNCSSREAHRKGTIKRAEVLLGATPMTQQAPLQPSPVRQEGHRLRDVYRQWKSSKNRSKDSLNACLRAVNLFEEFTGNPPIERLARATGDEFRAWLLNPDRKTTSKTARDRLVWVKSLLQFAAVDLGLVRRSPWSGIDIQFKTTNKRRPWTAAELATFFSRPLHAQYQLPHDHKAGADAAYWVPLLGLYTGARVGELAQLHASDVDTDRANPMLSITDEGDGQKVKTKAGIRQLPVHSELVRLGFLDYVEVIQKTGGGTLWPSLPPRKEKPGGYFSHWFGIYRRSLGFGQYPDFHCMRHTVRSQMAEAGISEQVIDTLIGHEIGGSTGAKVYTHRSRQSLSQAIETLQYPSITLKRVYQGNQ